MFILPLTALIDLIATVSPILALERFPKIAVSDLITTADTNNTLLPECTICLRRKRLLL